MEKSKEELLQEYMRQAHRMQAGVAFQMEVPGDLSTTPKHLRVGVNAAQRDHASLGKLLVEKGIITEEEYLQALVNGMKEEADAYEKEVQEYYGPRVKLGSAY